MPTTIEPQPTLAPSKSEIDQLCINTIRTLSMDAVQQANSGHPGHADGHGAGGLHALAAVPEVRSGRSHLAQSRPVCTLGGHASMLLYSMLHLSQVKAVDPDYEMLGKVSVTLDDIKNFRQMNSKCPGHPEYRWTSGIETTTGPLGQGVATSVGMALASRWMAQHFNRPGFEMVNFNVYALAGDGCMMEGVSGEAASMAGHLKLSNLCWIYDNNHITIEGNTSLAFSEDVATRFLGYGWNVLRVGDANDQEMVARALRTFQATEDRPTMIIVDSHIAYGAPHKQDTSAAHGEPLGEEEIRLTKRNYGWPEDAKVPGAGRRVRSFQGMTRPARTQRARRLDGEIRGVQQAVSRTGQPPGQNPEARAAGGLGCGHSVFPGRSEGPGRARRVGQGGKCHRPAAAMADRRRGRSGALYQDAPHLRWRGRSGSHQLRRAQHAFRHPRARHGIHSERAFAVQAAAVRLAAS